MIMSNIQKILRPKLSQIKVLIADDMNQNIKNNIFLLRQIGFKYNNIITIRNSEDEIEIASDKNNIQLIIIDYNMIYNTNRHLMIELRLMPQLQLTPIILTTSDKDNIDMSLRSFVDYIPERPYSQLDLEHAIFSVLASYFIKQNRKNYEHIVNIT